MVSDVGKVYEIPKPVTDPMARQTLDFENYKVRQVALGSMYTLVVTATGKVGYHTPLKSG